MDRGLTLFKICAAITLVAACLSVRYRISVESRNQATALAVEASIIDDAARRAHIPLEKAMGMAKGVGLVTVVLQETLVTESISKGHLQVRAYGEEPEYLGVSGIDQRRFQDALDQNELEYSLVPDGPVLVKELPRDLSLGLEPGEVAAAKKAGLQIICRHINTPGETLTSIDYTLANSKSAGADGYLPLGEQVLGQRELVPSTARVMERIKMAYIQPEFAKIAGDARMAEAMKTDLIRLHAIQSAEVDKLTPAEYVERFVKAARERNIRILLLRPLTNAAENQLDAFLGSIARVKLGLEKEGVPLGRAKPFEDSGVPQWLLIVLAAGIAGSALGVAQELFKQNRAMYLLSIIAVAACLAGAAVQSLRPITALVGAMTFPVGAYLLWMDRDKMHPLVSYFVMTFVSLIGGLSVAGMLNGLDYFVKIRQFEAVKVAHFLPIVVISLLLLSRERPLKDIFKTPITWAGMLGGFLLLAVLGFMLMRTGNDNPAGVSDFELRMRALLDWLLFTRPRTKEFLMGHPALIFGLWAYGASVAHPNRKLRYVALGLICLGAIGQTSVVNTLCHLHMPVLLSLARISIGWIIGGVLGTLAWFALKPLLTRTAEEQPA
ncbi:MAG: hypothetical protein JST40_00145 [Armatimonadetes bacterium]|nr:hypothetical protein [Armatimonadota bacterium]